MIIKYKGGKEVQIKSKDVLIDIGDKFSVNGYVISGPGEYEIAGVEVDAVTPEIFLLKVEDIKVAYFDGLNRELTDSEVEYISDSAVVFVPVGGSQTLDAQKAAELVKALEPKVVIPIAAQDYSEFCKLVGGCKPEAESYKVNKAQISLLEGITVIPLKNL